MGYFTIDSITRTANGYDINYKFTLTSPLGDTDGDKTHNAKPIDASGSEVIPVPVSVEDASGEVQSGTLNINVMDDVPLSANDYVTIKETGEVVTVTGNVVDGTGTVAGDDTKGSSVTGGADQYGADGKWDDSNTSGKAFAWDIRMAAAAHWSRLTR